MPDHAPPDQLLGLVAADDLRALVERIEHLEDEKKDIADQVKAVKAEAIARGYDGKALGEVLRLRRMAREERIQLEEFTETYKRALGMTS